MKTLTESAYRDKIVEALSSKRWTRVIDALRPNGVFTLNGMEKPFAELILENKDKFIDVLRQAVYEVLKDRHPEVDIESTFNGLKIRLTVDESTPMHKLNAREHENCVVSFDCEIIGMAKVMSYI